MNNSKNVSRDVVIRFAGDSGDGIQLIGNEFAMSTAWAGNDMGTLPDFPAEIRAPVGTLHGVSGFQIRFGSESIYTPGDSCDVLVVMNAAGLKKNLGGLVKGGLIIANEDGFDDKNLKLANFPNGLEMLQSEELKAEYQVVTLPVTKLTREVLAGTGLGTKEMDRCKNMFILGLLSWMYHRPVGSLEAFIDQKFKKLPQVQEANKKVLHTGYNFGETAELYKYRQEVPEAYYEPGEYRGITGNSATALGLLAAAEKSGLQLFYATYPITPASDILHELSRYKSEGAITFQAEDEIAAVCSAIGASFGGSLGVTASSGPGIDLKAEGIGLAVMLELPLVIIDVQRAGPSTGMPTKVEQSDLLLALFGRHGEAPLPVIAPISASDCFLAIYEAAKMAVEYMTPVFLLSDAYLANGTEPWRYPRMKDLPAFEVGKQGAIEKDANESAAFLAYQRDEKDVRPWVTPGNKGKEHRIGGLEKEDPTGNISYDGANHEKMVATRARKIDNIKVPDLILDSADAGAETLIVGWGSTYGALKTACQRYRLEGGKVAHAQLRNLNPLPANLGEIMKGYKKVIVAELNTGQLAMLLRAKYMQEIIQLNKMQGAPLVVNDVIASLREAEVLVASAAQ